MQPARKPSRGARYGRAIHGAFARLAGAVAHAAGSPAGFVFALLLVVLWLMSGPLLGFSTTWQLIINTTTTIVTFLMVFLIQNTQNRETRALHLKLDELLHSLTSHEELIDIEQLSDDQLDQLGRHYHRIRSEFERRGRKFNNDLQKSA